MVHSKGRAGLVLPSGIATDDSTSAFFGHVSAGQLAQLIDFENRNGIFPSVHRSYKFCMLTLGASAEARLAFFLTDTAQLVDPQRSFTLNPEDITRFNPNTHTCPVFRSQKDAEITKSVYQRVPVLWEECKPDGNPWGIESRQGLFNMTSASGLFRDAPSKHELADPVPLYEAKMVHQFDHRWATYVDHRHDSRDMTDAEKADPTVTVQPRYWVDHGELRRG